MRGAEREAGVIGDVVIEGEVDGCVEIIERRYGSDVGVSSHVHEVTFACMFVVGLRLYKV